MNEINKLETFLKVNSCKTNAIPKRREDVVRRRQARRTCSLLREKFYTFLVNKCKYFAKRLLPSVGLVGQLLPEGTSARSLP